MRRLLAYAGFPDTAVRVTDYTALTPERTVTSADARFTGVTADRVVTIDLSSIGDEVDLVGVLCHEAAAAWVELTTRDALAAGPFRVAPSPDSTDELAPSRASAAAIYLGFGIPATNAAHSARHGGYLVGNTVVTEWAVTTAGGLSVEGMVYLLATQLVVRAHDDDTRLALAHLLPNQQADLQRWLDALGDDREGLCADFDIPDPETWPAFAHEPPAPLSPGGIEVVTGAERVDPRRVNQGRRVYRVHRRRTGAGAIVGVMAGAVIAGVSSSGCRRTSGSASACAAAGLVGGFLRTNWECADPSCGRRVAVADTTCGLRRHARGRAEGQARPARRRRRRRGAREVAEDRRD